MHRNYEADARGCWATFRMDRSEVNRTGASTLDLCMPMAG